MKKPEMLDLLRRYFFAVAGGVLGLLIAILFMTIGFWRTLLICILMGAGWVGGMIVSRREEFIAFLDRILPGGRQDQDEEDIYRF